jgi:hypothetical protein
MSEIEKRLKAIEKRLDALEKGHSTNVESVPPCKKCGNDERRFLSTRKHPQFGAFGDTIDEYECISCGLVVEEHVKNRR